MGICTAVQLETYKNSDNEQCDVIEKHKLENFLSPHSEMAYKQSTVSQLLQSGLLRTLSFQALVMQCVLKTLGCSHGEPLLK